MYFITPGQKKRGNTNREHRAPVFPLKMLILFEISSFLGYKKVFFPGNKNFSKKISDNAGCKFEKCKCVSGKL